MQYIDDRQLDHSRHVSHNTSIPKGVKGRVDALDFIHFDLGAGMEWFKPSEYKVVIEVLNTNPYRSIGKPGPVVQLPDTHLGKKVGLVPTREGLPSFWCNCLTRGGRYIIAPGNVVDGIMPLRKTGGMI